MTSKTLQQWSENGWLRKHETSASEIRNLLDGGARKLTDARVDAVSEDGRFQFAYEAILRFAMAALAAEGFRASSQNHHYRSIASLAHTVGLDERDVRVLDTFRRKRNISVYDSAGEITAGELEEALVQAVEISKRVWSWLGAKHPELISEGDLAREG